MRFNQHSQLQGKHAFLSASKGAWLNYDEEKFDHVFVANLAAQKGTELHDLAAKMVKLGVRLPDDGSTLSLYVNDCIGFRMKTEQPLFYSINCFGTADSIGFRNLVLQIFDLKTGKMITGDRQLKIYAALFCLEYGVRPHDIVFDLRIYQTNEIREVETDADEILHIMDRIKICDARLTELQEEAE